MAISAPGGWRAYGGHPYSRSRDGITYLYAKLPAGRIRVDRFLGRAADPAGQAKAAALRRGAALARERRRTVAALRAAGFAGPGRAVARRSRRSPSPAVRGRRGPCRR